MPLTNDRLQIGAVTARTLVSREEGTSFFRLLERDVPEFRPERYGNFEPLRKRFDGEGIEPLLAAWEWPFLWKRRKGRVQGIVHQGISPPPSQGGIYLTSNALVTPQDQLSLWIEALAETFLADFALVHLLTPEEIRAGRKNDSVLFTHSDGTGAFLFVPPIQLRDQYVPDLYWLTIFGPSYVKILGRDQLLSAPAHRVRELNYGGVLLQLTPEITDISANYFAFLTTRNRVKEHLNCDIFFNLAKGLEHAYRRPNFLDR